MFGSGGLHQDSVLPVRATRGTSPRTQAVAIHEQTALQSFCDLVPIAHSHGNLSWEYRNLMLISCEFHWRLAHETLPLQYFNHMSDCRVQCTNETRNFEITVLNHWNIKLQCSSRLVLVQTGTHAKCEPYLENIW